MRARSSVLHPSSGAVAIPSYGWFIPCPTSSFCCHRPGTSLARVSGRGPSHPARSTGAGKRLRRVTSKAGGSLLPPFAQVTSWRGPPVGVVPDRSHAHLVAHVTGDQRLLYGRDAPIHHVRGGNDVAACGERPEIPRPAQGSNCLQEATPDISFLGPKRRVWGPCNFLRGGMWRAGGGFCSPE